jgi:hypothetical protein
MIVIEHQHMMECLHAVACLAGVTISTGDERQVSTGNSTAAGHLQKLYEQQPAK